MPCPFYVDGGCPLNFRIAWRDSNPCHMEAEGKPPEWKECSYNHPVIKELLRPFLEKPALSDADSS